MVIRKHLCLSQAAKSLDQLHKLAPADRKQYYMLSNVEHTLGDDHSAEGIKSPVRVRNACQVLQEYIIIHLSSNTAKKYCGDTDTLITTLPAAGVFYQAYKIAPSCVCTYSNGKYFLFLSTNHAFFIHHIKNDAQYLLLLKSSTC